MENLWEEAREIISDFNEYGGGPERNEDKACDNLWKMDGLVKENNISWDIRSIILDEMLEEFYEGNSGFDDILIEVGESFCKIRKKRDILRMNYQRGAAIMGNMQQTSICKSEMRSSI